MSFTIQYETVCAVHFWHDYVLARGPREFAGLEPEIREQILADYSIHNSLRITPTVETAKMLDRHRLRFVRRPTGFTIAGAVRASGTQPGKWVLESPVEGDFEWRFGVEVARPAFVSEASIGGDSRTTLLFSNGSGNEAEDGELHLTLPLEAFDPAKSYQVGDRVVDQLPGPTVLLEAAEDVGPNATPEGGKWVALPAAVYEGGTSYEPGAVIMHEGTVYQARTAGSLPEPTVQANWTEIYAAQLRTGVSGLDQMRGLGRESIFTLETPLPLVRLTVRDGANQVVFEETQSRRDYQLLHEVRLSLRNLPVGRYSLTAEDPDGDAVPGIPTSFHLHDGEMPFATVELERGAGAFAMFDAQGNLLQPEYHVRFRHRRAFWRYVFHGDLDDYPPTDLGDLVQEDAADPARYVTTEPLPVNLGLVDLKPFDGDRLLPNPLPSSARRESGKLFAEVYLSS